MVVFCDIISTSGKSVYKAALFDTAPGTAGFAARAPDNPYHTMPPIMPA
jgi:hypothetical protein